jgi:hypothetical protein
MRAVPADFLPPDAHADHEPPPQRAARPVFLPPNAPAPGGPGAPRAPRAAEQRQNGRATAALACGAGGLGLLFFSAGALFFLTIPASIAGWILGNQAKRREVGRDQANLAVTIGIIGVVLGVVAAIVWVLLVSLGAVDETGNAKQSDSSGVHFDVVRLVALLI